MIAVQNNFLSAKDVLDMKKALEEADKSKTDKQVIYQKYAKISEHNKAEALAGDCSNNPLCTIAVWEELKGGTEQGDSLKWGAWFDNLGSDDRAQLVNFVKAENAQSAQEIYQSLPTTVQVALQSKEILDSAGIRGPVAGSGISALGVRGAGNKGSQNNKGNESKELSNNSSHYDQNNLNKPLGLGSTGRNIPANLNEKLALEQAVSNPGAGIQLPVPMTDKRWPASEGWIKMSQNINGIEVHYVRNTKTGAIDDFKFK